MVFRVVKDFIERFLNRSVTSSVIAEESDEIFQVIIELTTVFEQANDNDTKH